MLDLINQSFVHGNRKNRFSSVALLFVLIQNLPQLLLLPIGEVVAVVVFEADGLGEELLHHTFLVVLQQRFLLDQLPNPPIHRLQEIRNLPLLGEGGDVEL